MLQLITRAQATLNSLRSEDGNAAEYGLIIAGVAVVIIAGLALLAAALNGLFTNVSNKL
jgi:Flp pilus assembly pilin Flp